MEPLQSTLLAYLRQVPDYRKARGQRFAWAYLLALVAAAVAAGQTTVLAMTTWAETQAAQLITALQPDCPRIPSAATWRRLVAHIDIAALEQQIAAHNQALDAADPTIGSVTMCDGQIFRGQAVDGKDVRGASAHGEHTFLVSLVRHDHAYVLRQAAVDRKTNEITAVPDLLAGRNLTGTVTTMDALLTQQRIAHQILAQGGHYLMIVKQNQPALYEAVALLFRQPPVPVRRGELRTAQTEGKDHGRLERRTLASSTALTGYLSWPGAAQVMRRTCRRLNMRSGLVETETTYGITSLPRALAGPNNWSNSGAGTGPLRTASTMCGMKPWVKIAVRSTPARRRRPWRPSATPSCRYCGSTVGATSRLQPAATPTSRNASCNSWEFLHYEITLVFLTADENVPQAGGLRVRRRESQSSGLRYRAILRAATGGSWPSPSSKYRRATAR
jgi:hypothetical protein